MILFGDMIDATLCVTMGFSTMAAAALGNTISDVAGVFSGGAVEDFAEKFLDIRFPHLDEQQRELYRKTARPGGALGTETTYVE